ASLVFRLAVLGSVAGVAFAGNTPPRVPRNPVALSRGADSMANVKGGADLEREWNLRLIDADRKLQAGKWAHAERITTSLQREMSAWFGAGGSVGPLLAMATTERALAAAGQGRQAEAEWHWFTAQNLAGDFRTVSLAAYGEPGRKLTGVRLSAEIESAARADLAGLGTAARPRKIAGGAPRYPAALAPACANGHVVVSVRLDEKGNAAQPVVLEAAGGPLMALAALEALR